MRTLLVVASLAASLVISPSASFAQSGTLPPQPAKTDTTDALTDQARELHLKGAALYEHGDYARAEAAFLAAWALKQHFQIAGNLGACQMKLGKYRDAAEHLRYFLREQPKTGNQDERKRTQALFDEARAKVATVGILVNVPDAVVSIDGRVIGTSPLKEPVFVDPGKRVVTVTRNGYKDSRQEADFAAGRTSELVITLASSEPTPITSMPRSLAPAIVLGGIAIAGLVAGTGIFVAGNGQRTTAEELNKSIIDGHRGCRANAPNFDPRCTDLASASSSADTLHRVGLGLLVGGGAAALSAGAYLLWPSAKPTTSDATLRILPVGTATSGGLLATGTF
jgi:hypothetical protein